MTFAVPGIQVKALNTRSEKKTFLDFTRHLYKNIPQYRSTEGDICRLILGGRSSYHSHSRVFPFLVLKEKKPVARFCLIHDRKNSDWVQAAFFDACAGVDDLDILIRDMARLYFPGVPQLVFGLNAHLNYGAGILVEGFDSAPVFGLPYNGPWYKDYFSSYRAHTMVSWSFPVNALIQHLDKSRVTCRDIHLRFMDKRNLDRDCRIYTELNNASFQKHSFWADRSPQEDIELFRPFSLFLNNENLIIAENSQGEAVGFLLWYPDFNQLTRNPHSGLGLSHLLAYRFRNPVDTIRFTEIGVRPEYRNKPVSLLMIRALANILKQKPYTWCEGGFIFESNRNSMNLLMRSLKRGGFLDESRKRIYAVYETDLV